VSADQTTGSSRGRLVAAGAACAGVALLVAVALLTSSGSADFEKVGAPRQQVEEVGRAVGLARCEAGRRRLEADGETTRDVRYRSNPPHSGLQAPEPASDGAYYDNPPREEQLVHSLRHGRVVIWFDPGLRERDKGVLKAVFDESPERTILVPRDGMPYQVAATAWRRALSCQCLNRRTFDAVRAFRFAYRDRAPESVP
jgi:hypothetical protein